MSVFIDPNAPYPQKSSKPLLACVAALLIIMAAVAGLYFYKYTQATDEVGALTSQLEDAEKQIAELQPLAAKARTMPITLRINRHALNAGYNLLTFNRSRDSLRFHYTVNGSRSFNAVIDGGKFWILRGLATGDTVAIESDGYDSKSVTIE